MKLTQKSYDGHVVQLYPPPKKKKEKSHTQKQSKKTLTTWPHLQCTCNIVYKKEKNVQNFNIQKMYNRIEKFDHSHIFWFLLPTFFGNNFHVF
jgi:hypothetical protein